MENKLLVHIDCLLSRYPQLESCRKDIAHAYEIMEECYQSDHKLLIAGNGGSAADSEHIAGELMKRFKTPRPVTEEFRKKLIEVDPARGTELGKNLERSLMAIPLVAHEALSTAISTSGNSKNVLSATVVARALGIKVIGLTGADGGELSKVADAAVRVPEKETYMIQELHLPVYHCWCLMLEERFFGV